MNFYPRYTTFPIYRGSNKISQQSNRSDWSGGSEPHTGLNGRTDGRIAATARLACGGGLLGDLDRSNQANQPDQSSYTKITIKGHVQNVIKCSPKNVIIGIMSRM
ncbi:hypothetical protein BpHYR1_017359 [Brachionus plicatilis]|uniref:Uncharacterized protein n=1 Tax=Brachionus plicatilis TaxID=10195 RepID=A0A3M7QV04_BRAPC|nr:hypothetical protein BpHYR1_017359 [Brachionus plicatilis]